MDGMFIYLVEEIQIFGEKGKVQDTTLDMVVVIHLVITKLLIGILIITQYKNMLIQKRSI